jgi:hypothetical protein
MWNIRQLMEESMVREIGKYWQEKAEDMQRIWADWLPRTAIEAGLGTD